MSKELSLLLLLLLLSRFSHVRLCVTPETAAHQAPQSLGFSRQEHRSGLPFPSPMHESEVAQSCLTPSNPMDCSLQAPLSMGFSRQEYWSGVPLPSPLHLLIHSLTLKGSKRTYCNTGWWQAVMSVLFHDPSLIPLDLGVAHLISDPNMF